MEKFNNTSIFTGYLKQLLHNFNLPKYRIYTKEHQKYFDKEGKERSDIIQTVVKEGEIYPNNLNYVPYIRNGEIQEYINGKWVKVGLAEMHSHSYINNLSILNYTKNLQIKGNSYDSYTHEYLGDYLRFQRDYNNINLMPLYNCFSNRPCDRLDISFNAITTQSGQIEAVAEEAEYNTDPTRSAGARTTKVLSTDAAGKGLSIFDVERKKFVEIKDENTVNWINENETKIEREAGTNATGVPDFQSLRTFKLYKLGPSSISKKIKFNTSDTDYKIYMVPVKLFAEYTIAIDSEKPIEICCGLYGDYQDTRDRFKKIPEATYKKYTISRFGQPFLYTKLKDFCNSLDKNQMTELAQNECDLKLFLKVPQNTLSTIVILEGNYLGWNDVVFNSDAKAIQNNTALNFGTSKIFSVDIPLKTSLQLLKFNTRQQHPFADRLIEYLTGNAITSADELPKNIMRVQKALEEGTVDNLNYQYKVQTSGMWDQDFRYIFYDYMNEFVKDAAINHDILGYVDKDVEKNYKYPDRDNPKKTISLLNTELAEEED